MSTAGDPVHEANPGIIFDNINAYQRSAALKAAIELDVFTEIAQGRSTADAIAKVLGAPTRGIRILCDYLVISGFLSKQGTQYTLTSDSSMFLDRRSPAYMGSATRFLLDPRLIGPFLNLTEVVRTGTTTLPGGGTVSHDNPIWVDFAREMMPMVFPTALEVAARVGGDEDIRVLDIAAGHGLYGITIAQRNPRARITALDWPNVVAVASENAKKFGVAERHSTMEGDAFELEFGGPYHLILVTNFFHHFDAPTCERLMRKILAALTPGGRCATVEFIPHADRVSPPIAAAFAMIMLGTTPAGDAYTFAEYDAMFRNAGFLSSEFHSLTKSPQGLVVSTKA
ncbi:MAG TPA: class I SAM-dependent methyltransferase [Bryobacteraceae bacterium]|jgi:ubiquinone/menaquinone biosynthesis C-methylase UbiE